jgi:putative copper resistance protein D
MSTWPLAALPWITALGAAAAYAAAWRRVNLRHPANPTSAWRLVAWVAGLMTILAALTAPLDGLADDFLTAHMVQHLLLTMVAPPLLAIGAPVLLLLRVSSRGLRTGLILPLLHSRPLRFFASPWLAWLLFTGVVWAAHFTPFYEAALEDERLHVLEHLAFLVVGCLFWWPVIGADPMPGRLRFGARLVYLLAQMPVNSAVGLAIYFAPTLLYAHYAAADATNHVEPLVDQEIAGLVMWGAGDVVLLAAVALVVTGWMRAEARRTERRHAAGPSAGANSS